MRPTRLLLRRTDGRSGRKDDRVPEGSGIHQMRPAVKCANGGPGHLQGLGVDFRKVSVRLWRFARHLLHQIVHQNFYAAKVYHYLDLLASNAKNRDALLVYQMGKVGSTTIVRSLRSLGLKMAVHHVHMLAREGIERFEAVVRESLGTSCKLTVVQRASLVEHLMRVKHLRRQLDRTDIHRKWTVVTLVRDPVARNLSSFFELLDLQLNFGLQERLRSTSIDEVLRELFELFDEYPDHELPLVFFDSELKPVFGLDVFATPFPKSKGFKIYRGENVEILLIRLESLDECASNAFQEFLGIEGFKVKKSNLWHEKEYAEVYKRFLDEICLPRSYIEKMYGSKFARHFYSEEEIQAFKSKWRTAPVA